MHTVISVQSAIVDTNDTEPFDHSALSREGPFLVRRPFFFTTELRVNVLHPERSRSHLALYCM